ncbi:MAG TPA: hypothetical protein VMR45_02140 [Patescibacteria group bacterium]|nr:hypothetical protein [Patescibacteria group bacterium]
MTRNEQPVSFTDVMANAEDCHARGSYAQAAELFQQGYDTAANATPPDLLNAGRAARGVAASGLRDGQPDAESWLDTAASLQASALKSAIEGGEETQIYSARRELVQTDVVIGQMLLGRCISMGSRGEMPEPELKERTLKHLRGAWSNLGELDTSEQPDQYRINAASRFAVAETLLGDVEQGRRIARQAWRLAWRSESPELPTAANRGKMHRYMAVGRAVVRAGAANVTARLVRPGLEPLRIAYRASSLAI